MTDNLITWNVRNWITVVLMVILGWLLIMTLGRVLKGRLPVADTISGYTGLA